MNYRFFAVIVLAFIFSFQASAQNKTHKGTYTPEAIKAAVESGEIALFDSKMIDLGPISKGDKKSFSFYFLNIGNEAIEYDFFDICSCSEVIYDEYAKIQPGEEAEIKVIFDSNEKEIEEEVTVDFGLKNMDKRINLPYFYSLKYIYQFK